jgi:serine/threonine protein kinase
VKLGVNKKTGEKVAIKVIDKTQATAEADEKRLKTEVDILKRVKHTNVVCLKDLYETSSSLYLIMELYVSLNLIFLKFHSVTGGELFDKIVEKGQYSEKEASAVVKKIIEAVDYLHSLGIAHRDLKVFNYVFKYQHKHSPKIFYFVLKMTPM